MLNLINSTNIIVFAFGILIAVALGGYLCYSKMDHKRTKKSSTKKKSKK